MKRVFLFILVFNFSLHAQNSSIEKTKITKQDEILKNTKSTSLFKYDQNLTKLNEAVTIVEKQINTFFLDDNFVYKLSKIYTIDNKDVSQNFYAKANILKNDILKYSSSQIDISILDSKEMMGTYALFTPNFKNKPTIFLNQQWINVLNKDQISKLLIEEVGHWIDFKLNGGNDALGDEGELFAVTILDIDLDTNLSQKIINENDNLNIVINGESVSVEMASLLFGSNAFFAQASSGTPANTADLESNTLLLLAALPGNRTVFVSSPPEDPYYSGNNVRGTLYAVDASNNIVGSWFGEVSRLFKVGSAPVACQFYVYPNPNNITTNTPNTTIFIDFYGATPNFATGQIVKTSSDPVATALNSLLPVNTPPNAFPNTGEAIEAGGLLNAIAGIPVTGNITSDDTDANTTYVIDLVTMKLLTVTDVLSLTNVTNNSTGSSVVFSSSTTSGSVNGLYGSLSVASNGTFTYTTNETNATVQALRLTTNTLTEVFTYKITDGKGGVSTSTLTVVIKGKNDTPIAYDNYDFAKESIESVVANQYSVSDIYGQKAIGNVLPNDTDVDKYGESHTILGVTATAIATTISQSTTLQFSSLPSNVQAGRFVWKDGDGIVNTTNNGSLLLSSTGQQITVLSTSGNVATLSAVPYQGGQILQLPSGTILGFSQNASGASYQEAIISGSSFVPTTALKINNLLTGQITVGMTVTGTGIPAGTTVTAITYTTGQIDQLTLSQAIAVNGATLTFTSSAGATLTGQYGSLVIQQDGSYVYTPIANNPNLNAGITVIDKFLYTMRDIYTDTSTATLYINVQGSGVSDPNAKDDSISATEAGGLNNATVGVNPTGNLLTNDTTPSGSLIVDRFSTPSLSSANASLLTTPATYNSITYDLKYVGQYGDFYIKTNGDYIYVVNNTLPAIESLKSGETLNEYFTYRINNSSTFDWANAAITIQGAYDTPLAFPNTNQIVVGMTDVKGNVTSDDTDVDYQDVKNLNGIASGNAYTNASAVTSSTTYLNGTTIAGTYGTLYIGADGSYSYQINTSNTAVQNLNLSSASLQEVFTYQIVDGGNLTNTSTLTITITANNKAPINTNPTGVVLPTPSPYAFTGTGNTLSAIDPDLNLSFVSLSVLSGTLAISLTGSTPYLENGVQVGVTLQGGAILYFNADGLTENNSSGITIYGNQAQVNAALASLIYTPNNGFSGSDNLAMSSTDVFGLTTTTTFPIAVSVNPINALDDNLGPINGLTGGNTTSVLTNDTLNGTVLNPSDVLLTGVTVPTGLTLNANGTITIAPNTTAGTYTVVYQICESANPTNCNTATVTITVNLPIIDAVNDTPTAITAGDTTSSVITNDTLDGLAAVIGSNPGQVTLTGVTVPTGLTLNANGTITVASGTPSGTYVVDYKICDNLNPTNCDTATATVVVSNVIDAVNDTPTAITAGDTTSSVITNDTLDGSAAVIGSNPGQVTLTGVTVPTGLTLNANGTITVASGTPSGTYTLTYQICENGATPANCDTATATVVVSNVIDAVNDTPTAITAGDTTSSVITNDTLDGSAAVIGSNPGQVTLTGVTVPTGLTLNANGTITVASGTPSGTYTLTYQICENGATPANCDTATATVVVSNVIDAVNDTPTAITAGDTTSSVITNDTLDGSAAVIGSNPGQVTLTGVTVPTGLTLNANGTITVASGTPSGTYTLTYQICENGATPANCDTATATVVVSNVIDAVNDTPTAITAGDTTSSVITNDTLDGSAAVIGSNPGQVTLTGVTVPTGLTLNANGTITVASGTPSGTYTLTYQICENGATPANCDTATATVVVSNVIDAVNDTPTAITAGDTTSSVITNDTLDGSAAVIGSNPGQVTLTGVTVPTGLTLNANGTITVASGTPSGTYTLTYQICENGATPANCDTATATVVVSNVIDAVNDTPTAITAGDTTSSVITNDTLDGSAAVIGSNPGQVTLTGVTVPTGLTLNANGTITVASGTPSGTYTLTYQICENGATPANCDTATATVVVSNVIDAVNDTPTAITAGDTTSSVITNDTLDGSAAVIGSNPGQVTLTGVTVPTGLTLNANGTITVASGTPSGTYTLTYQICENGATPANCDTATATVVVSNVIDAVNDTPTAITAGDTTSSVITNDTLDGSAAVIGSNPGQVTLTGVTVPTGLTLNANGTITVASGTPSGTYTLTYQICENGATPANCDTATATVVVSNVIDAVNDTPTAITAGDTTSSVITNDTLDGSAAVIGSNPGQVTLTGVTVPTGLTLNANGTITVASGTPSGTYTLTYQICENGATPANCDTATATVVVSNVIDAVNDTPTAITAGDTTSSVITNDTLDGSAAVIGSNPGQVTLTGVTVPTGLTLNANGTITVASGTPSGTYTLTYQICENGATPANCDTATATVVVSNVIDAVNDTPTAITAGDTTSSVITNDTLDGSAAVIGSNPGQVTLTGVTVPTGLTLNANGTITVASGTPSGTYTLTYQICENGATPANCDTATATVVVSNVIDAVNDTSAAINGVIGGTTPSVITNDTLDGSAAVIGSNPGQVTLTGVTVPTGLTLNANGTITVASGTPSGTYTLTYQICENGATPTNCDTATATVLVGSCIDFPNNDCDGDGVTNGQEIVDGTNPNNPCSFVLASQTLSPSSAWLAADCDGDGVTNGQEIVDGTNPNNPCSYVASSQTLATSGLWLTADCDGDGVTNGQEIVDGTNPNNPCSFVLASQTLSPSSAWLAADCDGDGVTNGQEIVDGTNPNNPCSYVASSQTLATSGLWLTADCDGDGVTNGQEIVDGTNPNNPCSFVLASQTLSPSSAWLAADCDGDGVTNGQEIVDGTNPNNPCSYVASSQTLATSGLWLTADCDGDGVTNGQEIVDGTNPNNPCSFVLASQTLSPSSAWLAADCDGDGVTNGQEIVDGTNPNNPCSYVVSSQTLTTSSQWLAADCDGDGVTNGQEIVDGTDPNNPCSSIPSNITLPLSQDFLDGDCDGDGLSNGEEIGPNPNQPFDPNGNGIPDYLEVNTFISLNNELEVFNLVTPNGDGDNDVFVIRNIEYYPDNSVEIYNRWGVKVFGTEGYGQNGKFFRGISEGRATISQSSELPVGTYWYILKYKNLQGVWNEKVGYLYLNK